jgi:cytochrome c-type biogenesis protein CcmF
VGIAGGSYWAYYELGWGGWWFWDPVENASFMPWLVGTALLHSLIVTEKRGSFKNWTVFLAIIAFSLSLLGTFLVRSGVLTSVHAFATDPRRGIFILILLSLVVGSSLTLFAWRAPKSALGGAFNLMSRETLMLIGNVLLVVASASVLLGTLYPLIIDALNLGKISVGPPYFNSVFVPVMAPVLFLMAVGPVARWKQSKGRDIVRQLWIAGVAAVIAAVAVPLLLGHWTALTALGFLLAFWVGGSAVVQVVRRLQFGNPPRAFWGGQLGHLGVAVFVIGVTIVSSYQDEKDVRMEPGDTISVGGYEVRMVGVSTVPGPNYEAVRGQFELSHNGAAGKTLYPEKRTYFSSTMPMTETAIDSGPTRDVYVSLGEPLDGKAWAVRVYYKPFVEWIWGGCLLMALGGLLALSDRRYRLQVKQQAPQTGGLKEALA